MTDVDTHRPAVRRRLVFNALAKGGWVCGRTLMAAGCGGNRYSARLHELRKDGVRIESRTCTCARCRWANDQAAERGHQPPYVKCYRLVGP